MQSFIQRFPAFLAASAPCAILLASLFAGCRNPPVFPIISADLPSWLQSTSPKTFHAIVKHPDLAAWEILAPRVLFNFGPPGSEPTQTGEATIGPNGTLSFTIPASQDGAFQAFKTVSFKWTASFRLRSGPDQIDAESDAKSFMIGCLPNDLGRTSPLAGVNRPSRLTVLDPCATFSGTVFGPLIKEDTPGLDGDTHIDLTPDPGFERFLRPGNLGKMVAEIVPADKPGCTGTPVIPPDNPDPVSSFGPCTGANIADPSLNTHITVTGPWVTDSQHLGWAEIHPVWSIK
jgi:hypothetical protein